MHFQVPDSEIGEVWKPACDNPPCDRNKIVRAMDALENAQSELAAMKKEATPEELELASQAVRVNPKVDKANAKLAASMKMLADARKATAEVINDPLKAAVKAANDAIAELNAYEARSAAAAAQEIADGDAADTDAAEAAAARTASGDANGDVADTDASALAGIKANVKMLEALEAEVKAIVAEEKDRRDREEGSGGSMQSSTVSRFDVIGQGLVAIFTLSAGFLLIQLVFVDERTGAVTMWKRY